MKKFKIEIEEILQKVCEVEAESIEDAMNILEKQYKKCNIVLDSEDFKQVNFREFK